LIPSTKLILICIPVQGSLWQRRDIRQYLIISHQALPRLGGRHRSNAKENVSEKRYGKVYDSPLPTPEMANTIGYNKYNPFTLVPWFSTQYVLANFLIWHEMFCHVDFSSNKEGSNVSDNMR
jgi:hypothetical protein